MKAFKLIDLVINMLLVIFFLFAWPARIVSFCTLLLVMWGWQLFSMIVHETMGWFMQKDSDRRVYHWVAIAAGCTLLLANFIPVLLILFGLLLLCAPILSIMYTILCYEECRRIGRRPLSYLKN
jgi:hypothetical protein